MKKEILKFVQDYISGHDLMDYKEMDLEILVRKISQKINKIVAVWVDEISDGKYKVYIKDDNNNEYNTEVKAWDSKEFFAEYIYDLFKNIK